MKRHFELRLDNLHTTSTNHFNTSHVVDLNRARQQFLLFKREEVKRKAMREKMMSGSLCLCSASFSFDGVAKG